jgi:hypothetical protein
VKIKNVDIKIKYSIKNDTEGRPKEKARKIKEWTEK